MEPVFMNSVAWNPTGEEGDISGQSYATHEGILHIFDLDLRCYRLNTGQAVIHGEDMENLLRMISMPSIEGLK